MENALRLYTSRGGYLNEDITAVNIRSYADARRLMPFCDAHGNLLYWVGYSKPTVLTGKKNRPHFKRYPFKTDKIKKLNSLLTDEFKEYSKLPESNTHKKAKETLCDYINNCISKNISIDWVFKDKENSDFPLKGNFIYGAVKAVTEYSYQRLEGYIYKFDIAILGNDDIMLGVVEIEKTHRFEFMKGLIVKSLGCPLMSINIEEINDVEEINIDWCKNAIKETTRSSGDLRRRNYLLIHHLLYPVYIDLSTISVDDKHQYVIFIKDEKYENLVDDIRELKNRNGFKQDKNQIVHVHNVNVNHNEPSSVTALINEGSIAGANYEEYSINRYIRITVNRPDGNIALYLFYIDLAFLLNVKFDTLVGYKYARGAYSSFNEAFWFKSGKKILPKGLSEPIQPILEYLSGRITFEDIKKYKI